MAFPSGSVVKNPPAVQEIRVCSLGGEDPLEEGIGNPLQIPWRRALATHSSILAWEISWTEEPGWLRSRGSQRVRHN